MLELVQNLSTSRNLEEKLFNEHHLRSLTLERDSCYRFSPVIFFKKSTREMKKKLEDLRNDCSR